MGSTAASDRPQRHRPIVPVARATRLHAPDSSEEFPVLKPGSIPRHRERSRTGARLPAGYSGAVFPGRPCWLFGTREPGVMRMRSTLNRLRSFQREQGFPYDQYVWVYSRCYRLAMRALHARGRHWHKRTGLRGELLWCHWCGDRRTVT